LRRPRLPVPVVTPAQREILLGWARRPTSAQGLALRARRILRLADGQSSTAVARQMQVHLQTVSKWRERFHSQGVDGLLDEPRPGQPRKIGNAQVEAVLARTLESMPSDATHGSTRSMAKATGLKQTAISRIWRALPSSRTAPKALSSATTPYLSTRCGTSSAST
jgi:transposase